MKKPFYDVISEAERLIALHFPSVTPSNPGSYASNPASSNALHVEDILSGQPIRKLNIKLPDIKLETFNGAYDEWISFRDSFTSIIHDNPSLSNIQKLHYLRSLLVSEPVDVIADLKITAENYTIA